MPYKKLLSLFLGLIYQPGIISDLYLLFEQEKKKDKSRKYKMEYFILNLSAIHQKLLNYYYQNYLFFETLIGI